jgi:hypothetical protein
MDQSTTCTVSLCAYIYGVIWRQILCPSDVECSNVSYHSTVFFWFQYRGTVRL